MKKQFFDDYFYLKKSERHGVLLFFLCSLFTISMFRFINRDSVKIIVQAKVADLPMPTKPSSSKDLEAELSHDKTAVKSKKRQHFPFNPNTISKDSLTLLGFSAFCADNLIKFRKKGGYFKNTAQLKKIYGLDTTLLNQLQPYIHLENNSTPKQTDTVNSPIQTNTVASKKALYPKEKIDLNRADSAQLVSIRGIGPFYAKKIINFRHKIGGLIRKEQLLEEHVIPDSTWNSIEPFIESIACNELKININRANYKDLIQHPYLDEKLVKIILQYRKNHGAFKNPEQLKNIKVLTPEIYEKLIPHLQF